MRVAVEGTALLVPRTGIHQFTHEVLGRLAARPGVEVSVFAVSWRGRSRLPEVVPAGIRVVTRPMAARPLRMAWMHGDHPTIERWTGPIDVVHGPNLWVPPARDAAEVVSVHDLTTVHFPELCTDDTRQYPALIQRAVDRGAWVQTIGPFVDEVVRVFGVDPDRVVAIDNGLTDPIPADPAIGRHLAGGERFVLGLGTVEPRKDFPMLVAAFDLVADDDAELRLVIAGGDAWGADALTAAVSRARHRDRIVRTGWVDEYERAGLLAGASVFAFSSLYEGFGFPPLEAMSYDTPVVATRAGGVPATVGDAALLTRPGDVEGFAGALARVLGDEALAADLVGRGRRNLTRFSWDRTATEMEALYRRAIDAR